MYEPTLVRTTDLTLIKGALYRLSYRLVLKEKRVGFYDRKLFKKILRLEGLEPSIFASEVRRPIH